MSRVTLRALSVPKKEGQSLVTSAATKIKKMQNYRAPNRRMHTVSFTEGIRTRREEALRLDNSARVEDRRQQAVQEKMRLGMSYDEAWKAVRNERAELFRND